MKLVFPIFLYFLKSYWLNIKLSELNVLKVIYKATKKLLSLRIALAAKSAGKSLTIQLIINRAMLYPKL